MAAAVAFRTYPRPLRVTDTPANILCYGEDRPLPGDPADRPDPRVLSLGPVDVTYAAGDLRYFRAGGVELLRRVYVAVRDRNWNTIPAELSDVRVEQDGPDGFRITYRARHRGRDADGEIDFEWSADVRSERLAGGGHRFAFAMDGVARSSFLTNRVGICVLHPLRHAAGRPCAVEHTDGSVEPTAFPDLVSPHQPFKDVRAITHEPLPGVRVEVRFEGDVFETEDQRNWTDGSFKTYSRPLDRPFPFRVEAGERVRQAVTVTVTGDLPPAQEIDHSPWTLTIEDRPVGRVPQIGLRQLPRDPYTEIELARLKALNLSHLRADLLPYDEFAFVAYHAIRTGLPLEVAVHLRPRPDAAQVREFVETVGWTADDADRIGKNGEEEQLRRLAEMVKEWRDTRADPPLVCRWLILHSDDKVTSKRWVELARHILGEVTPGVPVGGGTAFNFAELNRSRLPAGSGDFLSFAVSPQVHATDDLSIMENLEAQADVVRTARAFAPGVAIAVGPVTLKPGGNPVATGASAPPAEGELPPEVDPRQAGLVGAAWTLGSLKYLAEAGADFVTYCETVGWLGVMEAEGGPPLPEKFRSVPGGVFPLYHVLADVCEFAGGEVLACRSSDPLAFTGLVLRRGGKLRLLLASLQSDVITIEVTGLPTPGNLAWMDLTTVGRAMSDPEGSRIWAADTHRSAGLRATNSTRPVPGGFKTFLGRYTVHRYDFNIDGRANG